MSQTNFYSYINPRVRVQHPVAPYPQQPPTHGLRVDQYDHPTTNLFHDKQYVMRWGTRHIMLQVFICFLSLYVSVVTPTGGMFVYI